MLFNLLKYVKIWRVTNETAAGTGTVAPGVLVDMQGFDGVMFILAVGAFTAGSVTQLNIQGGQQSGGGDQANLNMFASPLPAGTPIASTTPVVSPLVTGNNQLSIVDLFRPGIQGNSPYGQRYIGAQVTRTTQNCEVNGVFALLYRSDKRPTIPDATTVVGANLYTG